MSQLENQSVISLPILNPLRKDDGLLENIIAGLKAQSLPLAKIFKIHFSLIQDPKASTKLLEMLKIMENYDKYYGIELETLDSIASNDRTTAFFKALSSKTSKINSLSISSTLSSSSTSIFKNLLKKNTTITDLSLNLISDKNGRKEIASQITKALSNLNKNTSLRRLKLTGTDDEYAALGEILRENHSITAIEINGRIRQNIASHVAISTHPGPPPPAFTISCINIQENVLPALAKMGSLKEISFKNLEMTRGSVQSLSDAIKCNASLEKLAFHDRSEGYQQDDALLALLGETIVAHPSLKKLTLPGTVNCPLLKSIAKATTIRTLGVPFRQINDSKELQQDLLAIKSLRKLKFVWRGEYEVEAPDIDLTHLVLPSSQIQHLVFEPKVRFKPTLGFMNTLAKETSVQRIKFKDQFYFWDEFFAAAAMNPFLDVQCGSSQYYGQRVVEHALKRKELTVDLRNIIHCLSILRTIYLAADRGILFGPTMPYEIALHIWSLVFHEEIRQYSRKVLFNEHNLNKLIRIASDRSKLGSDPDTVKRLRSLWIEDELAKFV